MPVVSAPLESVKTDRLTRFSGGIRIVADDLTGACDAAVAFVGEMSARVWLAAEAECAAPEHVQAYVTQTRGLEATEAAARTRHAFRAFAERHDVLAFKKIDSCMRGQVGAEVVAALESLGADAAVIAPSFPAARRTVAGGLLCVDDSSLTPMMSFFPEELHAKIAVVREVDGITAARNAGKSLLLYDAGTQEELEELAAFAEEGLLLAGSAGLAYALAGVRPGGLVHGEPMPKAARTLVICGTDHAVTAAQMEMLERELPGVSVLRIHVEAGDEALVAQEFARVQPEALVLTGGDTAMMALQALGADSIAIKGAFEPGVPWGVVQSGSAHGCVVVTKSGGFGRADTMTRIAKALGVNA